VLYSPYDFEKAKLVVREMTDMLVLDLVDKGLLTDQMVLTIGYDVCNLSDPGIKSKYKGEVTTDRYGRSIPKHAHGSINLSRLTSSTKIIVDAVMKLYDRIVDKNLYIRRITVAANNVVYESSVEKEPSYEQLSLFAENADEHKAKKEEEFLQREKKIQKAVLDIKKKYGKDAILKGMNLQEGATAKERNRQIGGHKA